MSLKKSAPLPTALLVAALVAALLAAVAPRTASAGIYNMQSILATEAEEGLTGAVSGSADWRTGNVSYLFLSATPLARYRHGKHLLIGMIRGDHKTSKEKIIISKTLEHLRYRYQVSESLLGELFTQHEFDDVKRLSLRALVGAGPKLSLLNSKSIEIDLGVSYMLEYEKLRTDDTLDSGVTDLQHRNSSYLTASYQSDERFQVGESVYFQPRLTDTSDLRLLSQSQITFKLTERLSYTASFTVAYDSRPPDTIERLDTALKTSLTYEI